MSMSHEWDDYHLTTQGWVHGSYKTDTNSATVVPVANRLLTRRYTERLGSPWSKPDRYFRTSWIKKDSQEEVKALLAQYPYPAHYSDYKDEGLEQDFTP